MTYALGIDLGTTFCAAAVHRDGRTETIALGNRTASIPSLVFLREDESVLTGEAALRRGTAEPARLARQFKRRVGDSTPIMLGRTPYSAERLMASLLRDIVEAVTEREGSEPDSVTISHPANWGPFKTDLLRQGVKQAGLRDAHLVTEPLAAAIHYASAERVEGGEIIAVYDLGGGTFDAAILRKTVDGFEQLGEPEGIERLGGIDFDEAVFLHVRESLSDAFQALDPDDPGTQAALSRLRQECVDAKEALSSDSDVTIPVLLPGLSTQVLLQRSEFEAMIRPTIRETIAALQRSIDNAGVTAGDLKAILLVGGSSRIPLVAELVSDALGRPVAVDTHPKHAVALGAALIAASGDLQRTAGSHGITAASGLAAGAATGAVSIADSSEASTPAPVPEASAPAEESEPLAPAATQNRPNRAFMIGGLVLVAAAVVVGIVIALSGGSGGDETDTAAVVPDEDTTASSATATEEVVSTTTALVTTTTQRATTTTTTRPTTTTEPPLVCESASGLCVHITDLVLEGGVYKATYETTGFIPRIVGEDPSAVPGDHHIHFFFDTTDPENAGSNGSPPGSWALWDLNRGEGLPIFDLFSPGDRGTASQMCAVVVTESHAVLSDAALTGTCVDLP